MIQSCQVQRFLLSYSDYGHVPRGTLVDAISRLGELTVHELGQIGRYRPNEPSRAARPTVAELLLDLRKVPVGAGAGG